MFKKLEEEEPKDRGVAYINGAIYFWSKNNWRSLNLHKGII
jgi:hypothetical protein